MSGRTAKKSRYKRRYTESFSFILGVSANRAISTFAMRSLIAPLLPGGTVGYPAQPRLICLSVRPPLSDITFNYSAKKQPGPTNLVKYSLKIVN